MSAPEIPLTDEWHRVHILSPLVRAGRGIVPILFVLFTAIRPGAQEDWTNTIVHAVFGVVLVIYGFIYWLVTRWRIEGGTLRIETGLLKRSSLQFPLDQIQAVDTVRSGVARVFGLSELRLRMAGSTGKDGRLAYLKAPEAEIVRGRLLALAHGMADHTPEPPEHVLLAVPTGRLVWSILLSHLAIIPVIVLIALIAVAAFSTSWAIGLIGAYLAPFIGIVLNLWRRFNSGYHMTIAEAPDGLRLRSGLVETSAETIPRGRIQAVRMVEPWLWRRFNWCRLEIDVAGKQKRKGENKSEGRSIRIILPIGDLQQANWLLTRLLPEIPIERLAPPVRARWKSPLNYHFLSWGRNESCVVVTYGRVQRITDWVPLVKVQSIRKIQGPVQRRLRLANIHLDTAGRNIHAVLRDRDEREIDADLDELIEKCRRERNAAFLR